MKNQDTHPHKADDVRHSKKNYRWGIIAYFTLGTAVVAVTLLQVFAPQIQQLLQAKQSSSYSFPAQPQSSFPPSSTGTVQHTLVTPQPTSSFSPLEFDGSQGQGIQTVVFAGTTTNTTVLAQGRINSFQSANWGIVLRYKDASHWDKVSLDGSTLVISQQVGEESLVLASLVFPAQADVVYTLRFQATGSLLEAKAWISTQSEPATWMLSSSDLWLDAGQNGVRVALSSSTHMVMTQFTAQALS